MLGLCLVLGAGVAQDAVKGLALGRESAAAGSCFGHVVGVCCTKGLRVTQDDSEAAEWYRLAAGKGHAGAQYFFLGTMFLDNLGVALDCKEAERWYLLAAAHGLAHAQFGLGLMIQHGHGAAQDYSEAVRWYHLAAAQGYAGAAQQLAC
jgi:TPR repeat protein